MVQKPEGAEVLELDWDAITYHCGEIFKKLKKYDIVPDIVLGINRGGIIPGALIARLLNRPFVVDHQNLGDVENILIVDDILDTGKTMDMTQRAVGSWGKAYGRKYKIYIAAICQKQQSKIKTIYHGLKVEDSLWVKFPWEIDDE